MEPLPQSDVQSRLNQERSPGAGVAWRLLLFLLFVFGVFFLSYFGLAFGYKAFIASQIEKRDADLEALAGEVSQGQQDQYLAFQFQLINLKTLLARHVAPSKIFSLLEQNTNQRAYYRGIDLSVAENRVRVQLVAQSYEVLAQQLATYERMPGVMRYQLDGSQLAEGGRVSAGVVLFFDPKFFKS